MPTTTKIALLCLSTVLCQGQEPARPRHFANVDRILTGVHETEHFEIRFRPGSRAAASVDQAAVVAERDLADICKQLEVAADTRFILYLYDSVRELATITATSGNAGFSFEDAMHIPYDNDQTRYHELVHVVAKRLPSAGEEKRSLFFAEGLANALLEFVSGVHVDSVAAFELRERKLPGLAEMTGARDFYAWLRERPWFNAYDVSASWFRFLLARYGATKVKRYYTGMPGKDAFGKDVSELEALWHEHLRKHELRPAVMTLLKKRRGMSAEFTTYVRDPDARLPSEVIGKPEDWKPLDQLKLGPDVAAHWTRNKNEISGLSTTTDWDCCTLGDTKVADVVLRARIRPAKHTVGVQIRLGPRCQLLLTNAGTFLYGRGVVAMDRSERITGRAVVDLVLARRGDEVTGYVDGLRVVKGRIDGSRELPAIGVAGGRAVFESVRLRTW